MGLSNMTPSLYILKRKDETKNKAKEFNQGIAKKMREFFVSIINYLSHILDMIKLFDLFFNYLDH